MKKTLISCLIMTLIASSSITLFNTSKVYAATSDSSTEISSDDTIKVSLDNIKEIMTENNLDIKILFNKMKIANETYHDALDEYRDYQDEFDDDDEVDKPDADDYITEDYPDGKYNPDYTDAKEEYDNYQKYVSSKNEYETALDDYKTARDAYETGIEDKVNSARTAYVSYLSAVSSRELQENAVKVQQRNVQTYKLQYDSGFLSKNEYNKYVQQNTTESDSLSKLKNAEALSKLNLCNTLGISYTEKITFSTDIKADLDKVSQINYDNDLNQMLDNNVNIRTANDDISDLEDDEDTYEDNDQEDIYDYKMNSAEVTLKQAINTAKSDFQGQYNSLMSSYNTMKNNYDSLNLQKTDYAVAQVKYDFGFISKNDLENSKIGTSGLDSVNSGYENAKNDFYNNYLRYLQMKEGY